MNSGRRGQTTPFQLTAYREFSTLTRVKLLKELSFDDQHQRRAIRCMRFLKLYFVLPSPVDPLLLGCKLKYIEL